MSWFWGSSSSNEDGNNKKNNDALRKLDPDLKEFLEKESPSKYQTNSPQDGRDNEPETYRSQLGLSVDPSDPRAAHTNAPDNQPLPKQSLFQDGRYKNIWDGYRPLGEVEQSGKSDSDKLSDIVLGYKERKASVGRAALENCAEEQWAVHECFRRGGLAARMTMCKAENRAMERCYTMQSRFLKALGYMSLNERPDEVQENIQMHAHALYHKMLEQERLVKDAKDKGLDPPQFEPIIPERNPVNDPTAPMTGVFAELPAPDPRPGMLRWEKLSDKAKEELTKQRFEKLSPEDQELELRAYEAELAVDEVMANRLEEHYKRERRERLQRQMEGRERMSDKIKRWFDMRNWSEFDKAEAEKEIQKESERITSSKEK